MRIRLSFIFSSFIFVTILLTPHLTLGRFQVWPTNAGSVSGPVNPGGTIFYYAGSPSPMPTPPAFVQFTPVDLSVNNDNGGDPKYSNLIKLNVQSTVSFPAGLGSQVVVLVFTLVPFASSTTTVPIANLIPAPIATLNGISCSQANSGCLAFNWSQGYVPLPPIPNSVNPTNHYYAAIYPGSNAIIEIGFYPQSLCHDSQGKSPVTACLNADVFSPSSLNSTTMQLYFGLFLAPNANALTVPMGNSLDWTNNGSISLNFDTNQPSINCPSSDQLAQSYSPGDSEIFLNSSLFSVSGAIAPLSNLYVVGALGRELPEVGSDFGSNSTNAFSTKVSMSENAAVGGFLNSQIYSLSFIAQNAAGVFAPPASPDACLLSPVETSEINGFLPKGSKDCFIATAAFGSPEGSPLELLRSFRDQILLKTPWGNAFVKWYYHWSPYLANWLIAHSFFRIPILFFLFYLEGIAFICLNIKVFSLCLLLGAPVAGGCVWIRKKK